MKLKLLNLWVKLSELFKIILNKLKVFVLNTRKYSSSSLKLCPISVCQKNNLIGFCAIVLVSLIGNNISAQQYKIDWSDYTLSGFSQTLNLPGGSQATMQYGSANNVSYRIDSNVSAFKLGDKSGNCAGVSNTMGINEVGLIIIDDYNNNHPRGNGSNAAVVGKDWKLSFHDPVEKVKFDLFDLTAYIHSASYPITNEGIYQDQIEVKGKDFNGNTIYPTISHKGHVFIEGLNKIVPLCVTISSSYAARGYSGTVNGTSLTINNSVQPPTAYTVGGSLNSATATDADCKLGGFAYGRDVTIDFGNQILTEITLTYKNVNNVLLGAMDEDVLGPNPVCELRYTSMAPQGIIFSDISYEFATLPIELVEFTGEYKNYQFELNWITLSESNNKGFVVEHSLGGVDFNEIGYVNSKSSNSNEKLNYLFKTHGQNDKVNFFRLKQEDLDGKVKYSNVLEIEPSLGTEK